jgi:FAD synthetase
MRVRIVNALKPVDEAILGGSGDMYETVERIRPDIIVLGFDQTFDPEDLQRRLEEHGLPGIRVVRAQECADDLNATRRIIQRIRSMERSR